ncbi:MAG: hypothetical protein SGI92_23385 [Bryobacteraceae bacterium]|nr:hypothetical protein [Bryobacteraceae bacterium]
MNKVFRLLLATVLCIFTSNVHAGQAATATGSSPAAQPRGSTQFPAPNNQNWSPLGLPILPPSYYTVPAPGFYSPPPAPRPVHPVAPGFRYGYPAHVIPAPVPREESYRYYCPDSRQYYPVAASCPSAWLKVVVEAARTP